MLTNPIISINASNNNRKSNQHVGETAVRSASGLVFEDYLKAQLQQVSNPVITRQAESHVAGLLMGYITPLKITFKSEPELEVSAG